jgi:hypothetical protein
VALLCGVKLSDLPVKVVFKAVLGACSDCRGELKSAGCCIFLKAINIWYYGKQE